MERKYGWRRDIPDQRDMVYSMPLEAVQLLPRKFDLRNFGGLPPVVDQLDTRTCTGQVVKFALEFDQTCCDHQQVPVSALFPYYNARVLTETVALDLGSTYRAVFKALNNDGWCHEELWPFAKDRVIVRPSDAAYADGRARRLESYSRIPHSADTIKMVLSEGRPVLCGVSIYESYEKLTVVSSGLVPVPQKTERKLGGHAVALIGYDDDLQVFFFRNSVGPLWGEDGYGRLPYGYVLSPELSADHWVIKSC